MSGGARTAAVGIAQFGLVVIVTRTMSVGVQVALGWLLLPRHFGSFAVALAVTNIVFSFRELGVGRFLTQQPAEFEAQRRPAMAAAVATNGLLAVATAVVARVLTTSSSHDIVACIDILAVALLVAAPAAVYQAKLAVAGRFSAIARFSALSAAVRYAVTVAAATLDAGATSLAWGALAAALFDSCTMRSSTRSTDGAPSLAVGRLAAGMRLEETGRFLRKAASPGAWIGVSTLAIAMQTQGDNLVVGWLTDPATLGVYFFAYQLTVAVSSVFTVGFSNILLPSLASVGDGSARRGAAERALRMTGTLGPPVAAAAAFLLPEAIVAIWGTRWLAAARPAEILALTVGTRLLTPVSMAVYQAQGKWRVAAYVGLTDGVVVLGAAALGAVHGVVAVAFTVGAARAVASAVESGLAGALMGLPPLRTLQRSCTPSVVTLMSAAPWLLYRARYVGFGGPIGEKLLLGLGLAVTLLTVNAILYRRTWHQFVELLRRRPAAASLE